MNDSLDLFSTSQTKVKHVSRKRPNTDRKIYDACSNNAPYFAYQISGKKWGITQGCCNDWNCPRCGQQRAREEYGRIVHGAREIGKKHELFMVTITCRGKEEDYETAENAYLARTNKLLTRIRTAAKRNNQEWAYASVTERQARMHPHSHYLTTYCPPDAVPVKKGENRFYQTTGMAFPAKHDCLQSLQFESACVECGLGWQYDISRLGSIEGASRYVAKYLFKETIFSERWPKGWRRVRYSQSWPKLPEVKGDAIVLISRFDWFKLSQVAAVVITRDDGAKKHAQEQLAHSDTIVQ